jgi:hypothetical protein
LEQPNLLPTGGSVGSELETTNTSNQGFVQRHTQTRQLSCQCATPGRRWDAICAAAAGGDAATIQIGDTVTCLTCQSPRCTPYRPCPDSMNFSPRLVPARCLTVSHARYPQEGFLRLSLPVSQESPRSMEFHSHGN